MATILQKNLAKNIVENTKAKKPKNKRDLLVSVGYDLTTATANPDRTIRQKGVQTELVKMGFDPENAKRVVGKLLDDERVAPKDRLRAASEVFKVHGTYAPEKSLSLTYSLNELSDEELRNIADGSEKGISEA